MEKLCMMMKINIMSILYIQGTNNNKYEETDIWIVSGKELEEFLKLLLLKSMDSLPSTQIK
jgi:hypothetical protein